MSSEGHNWKSDKLHVGQGEKLIFMVQPSSKYPGCWWVCKIEHGVWEGFERPLTQFGFEHWQKSLPEGLAWSEHEWDGSEMTVPLDGPRIQSRSDCVYFMEAVGLNRVKIGLCTGDPKSRLEQIRLLSPVKLRVIGQIPGDAKTEHALRERFAMSRLHGEWFEFDGDIREYITLNCEVPE